MSERTVLVINYRFEPVLQRELLRLVVLGQPLADLGDPLPGPGPSGRRRLLLVDVEEGDGLDAERGGVVGLPPELLDDDGAIREAPARAVALEDPLHPRGRLVELGAQSRGEVLEHDLLRRGRGAGARLLLLLGPVEDGEGPRARPVDAAAARLPVLEAERALEAAAAAARHLGGGAGGRAAGARRPQRRTIAGAVPLLLLLLRGEEEEVAAICVERAQSHLTAAAAAPIYLRRSYEDVIRKSDWWLHDCSPNDFRVKALILGRRRRRTTTTRTKSQPLMLTVLV
jgi:hypothetical protein